VENKPQKLLTGLAIAFAVFTLLVTIVFFGWWAFKERLVFGDEPFDPVVWMNPEPAHTCERGDMVLDIKRRLLKPGMTKSEVMMQLGRPTWEDPTQIEYDLGVCLWVVHGLRLYFDQQERLVHSAIVQH
jgi:hypothetical protein